MQDEPTEPLRYHNVFGRRVYIAPRPVNEPRAPGRLSMPWVLAIVGSYVTGLHELVYRQTGGDEFPVLRVVSHAGGDMLGVVGVLVLTAALTLRAAERGVR